MSGKGNRKIKTPTLLVILDGWGTAKPSKGNAIHLAKTPVFDNFTKNYPNTLLGASGEDVGLERNQMSGSETGHMNIGAGKIVTQDVRLINDSIRDRSFFVNPALISPIEHSKKYNSKLHLMGLMGNEDSPHSQPGHFEALLKLAKERGIEEVYMHLFTDGRDSYPNSALDHLKKWRAIMDEAGIGKIASLGGRFWAMDRAKHWDRSIKAFETIAFGKGKMAESAEEAIENNYKEGKTDEYLDPTVILENKKPVALVESDDAVIFFNLRSDRARQFSKLFVSTNCNGMSSQCAIYREKLKNIGFTALTEFGPDLELKTAFPSSAISPTMPMAFSNCKQLYTSETEKYAHVTYFLNGGYPDPVGGEDRIMIESPKVDSYVKIPQMSGDALTQNIISNIEHDIYDFICVNYPNADMLGHTGDLKATIKAVEIIDVWLKKLCQVVNKKDGRMIVTADHGNADEMIDFKNGNRPHTFHTKNPVPFIVVDDKIKGKKLTSGSVLANILPTLIEIVQPDLPSEVEFKSFSSLLK